MQTTVFSPYGQRKYLTRSETEKFIRYAMKQSCDVQSLCWMIAFTGCRISEALSLTRESIDFTSKQVVIKCLKKRGQCIFRTIPLPQPMLTLLKRWLREDGDGRVRLWSWSRMTAYRRIRDVMHAAGIEGAHASPKGLRHGFGVRAIQASVPLTLVQRWLGHAHVKTTAIYTSVMGPEERAIAARMWSAKRAHDKEEYDNEGENQNLPECGRADWAADAPQEAATRDVAEGATVEVDGTTRRSPAGIWLPPRFLGASDAPRPDGDKPTTDASCSLIHFWLKCNIENTYFS